ncbi:hypothetical protein F4777DRAFT_537779 [Nemania sp. FL0916]|nr:hypothetical protein F4777DRAFT_537779 [Nemania sp. FL0916]
MLNGGPQGGWGASASNAPPNPFQSVNPPPANPFAKPRPNPFQSNTVAAQQPAHNPFSAPTPKPNPFSATTTAPRKRSASPSAAPGRNPFEPAKHRRSASSSQSSGPPLTAARQASPGNHTDGSRQVAPFVQPAWGSGSNPSTAPAFNATDSRKYNNSNGANSQSTEQNHRNSNSSGRTGTPWKPSPAAGPRPNTRTAEPHGASKRSRPGSDEHDGRAHELAAQIQQQLAKDRIKPPSWPTNPGNHKQRKAMENFRESYKAYREKARKSLIRAGLIDDPDQRRTLEEALDFRGVCEDMCPEWEKITRIVEYDVRLPEKTQDNSGDLVAEPALMVKRLARSAAGQDAPLPMDVRSFATLRRTLDYLINDLIPEDDLLPSKHNFLWDRTRAIRIDLSMQKYNMTSDERADLVYCLETIARFHVTALHLLSQDGFAAEDFSEQQEVEQLGKTLISLKELYDDCVEQNIHCENEAEFRGYYAVFNARDPSIRETVEGWGPRLWSSDGIRTALCLVESLQNTWSLQGPLKPHAPTELALSAATVFFSIVDSPEISYTMACFAEIHFNAVRKSILQIIRKSYSRPREGPKDVTPEFLKTRLRFDTEEEAVSFAQQHGIVFGRDGTQQYAILNSRQPIENPRIRHSFSRSIVERKRSNRSLPDLIHQISRPETNHEPTDASQKERVFAGGMNPSSNKSNNLAIKGETNGLVSATSSNPPVVNGGSSGSTNSLSQTHNPTSIFSQPPQMSGPPTNMTSVPVGSTPIWGQQSPTTNGLDNPSQSPPTTINSEVRVNAPVNTAGTNGFTSFQHSQEGAPQAKEPSVSSSTPAPNIFASLMNNNNKLPPTIGNQPSPDTFLGTPTTKPSSLFSSNTTMVNTPTFPATTPTTTLFSGFPSSSGSAGIQKLGEMNERPLAEQTKPPVSHKDEASTQTQMLPVASPKTSSSFLFPEKSVNIFEPPSSADKSLSTLPNPAPEIPAAAPKASVPSASTLPAIVHDPMDNFTRWYVLADGGLMESELEETAVTHVLRTTWENFQTAEKERIQQEEDEKLLAEALEFRRHSLKITFFYRWRNTVRKRRVVKRIQLEKEKAQKWNSLQSVKAREAAEIAARDKAVKEAKELVQQRAEKRARETAMMRESVLSSQSIEDALLATGVFSGVRDERAAARYAAQDDHNDPYGDITPAERLRLHSENQRRRKRGLHPLKRFPEESARKAGSKTAMLRAVASGTGRDSMSASTSSLRNSTFSSSYRSSLGFNRNRVTKSRTNVSDPYWRMKANGLVQMPNGEYLHESLALPMLREGKRFPGLGDFGLPPVETCTPSQSPPSRRSRGLDPLSSTTAEFLESNSASRSPSVNDETTTQKRKRVHAEDEDLTAYRKEAPASRKRAKSDGRAAPTTSSADQGFLDGIASLLSRVEAATKS